VNAAPWAEAVTGWELKALTIVNAKKGISLVFMVLLAVRSPFDSSVIKIGGSRPWDQKD
jgi:hypothetical protein